MHESLDLKTHRQPQRSFYFTYLVLSTCISHRLCYNTLYLENKYVPAFFTQKAIFHKHCLAFIRSYVVYTIGPIAYRPSSGTWYDTREGPRLGPGTYYELESREREFCQLLRPFLSEQHKQVSQKRNENSK